MSDRSTNLQLPYLAAAQAQKHVTVNEALRALDALVQICVESATTAAEPGAPSDGQCWIVPSGKTGTHWASLANWSIAYWVDGAWATLAPREGWIAYVRDTDQILTCTSGGVWAALSAAIRVSATDKVLGRISASAGPAEEIAFTDQAQALCDDASFAAMRATLGAAIAEHPGYTAGRWYMPLINGTLAAGGALTSGRIYAAPFLLRAPVTITDLGARVNTAASGGNFSLAIYAADATTHLPTGTKLASTGSLSTSSAANVSSAIVETSVTLQPGLYWMMVNADATAGGTAAMQSVNQSQCTGAAYLVGSATENNVSTGGNTAVLQLFKSQTFGTWPDLTGSSWSESASANFAIVHFKAG